MTDEQIWRIIAKHYSGSVNPPSLLAQKMFDVAKEIEMVADIESIEAYESRIRELWEENWRLDSENRQLKGLPPLKPIAMAAA